MRARWRWRELTSIACALFIGAGSHPSCAQPALTGVVLSGASLSTASPTRLTLGSRIVSPPKSWTEIVFSDGSSIVLGPGAQLTAHQLAFDPKSARNRIVVSGGGGQIRVETANDTEADIAIPGAEVRVIAAGAVLRAAPPGSVSMLGGREVVVSQRSRHDTLRRPGFSVALDGSGPQRDSEQQLVAQSTPLPSAGSRSSTAEPTPAQSQPLKRTPPVAMLLVTAPLGPSRGAVASASLNDALSTGLTSQSGSLTQGTALKFLTLVPGATTAIPELSFSGFSASNLPSAPPPPTAGNAPSVQPVPFVTVDSTFLAGIPGMAGSITVPGTGATVSAGLVPSNEHLSWGFFLPAESTTSAALAFSAPDNLTFQVSGPGVPTGTLQMLTGLATYVGGLIGSAQGQSGFVRQTGQFAQTWNFGTRSGSLNANFAGSSWVGIGLTMPSGTNVYAGSGTSTTDQRFLSLQGGFYNSSLVSRGVFPSATGGSFSVSPSITGQPGAGGIFVGTRR